jgi:hypothetical protein
MVGMKKPRVLGASAIARPKPIKKEEVGQRGKTAEKLVIEVLTEWNNLAAFAWDRPPDARAAMGRMKSAIADFYIWYRHPELRRVSIPLEVKSTEHKTKNGSYLLSKDALDQLPNLRKLAMAGADPFVLVLFKATGMWRVAPVEYFESGVTSWDMRDCPEFPTAKAALQSTGFFPMT